VRGRVQDEGGAIVVITAFSLVAIFGMLVLTVDVGGLLLRRRSMVNGADAAALAAAKSCASIEDTFTPESRADIYAAANVSDLVAENGGVTDIVGCDDGPGYVTVQYSTPQSVFFAGVLGLGDTASVTTRATAAWGPAASAFAAPIVLDSGYLQGVCKVPDGVEIGDTCAFWYNNGDATLGDATWGFMNLDQWGVDPNDHCSNAGTSSRAEWIVDGYLDGVGLNGSPAGSEPTYVCNDTGHSSADWSTLHDEIGTIKYFPVNDCEGQLGKDGHVSPCPGTPDKYDIIGFTGLMIDQVYRGNDDAAIGEPGAAGTCTMAVSSLAFGQVKNLADSFGVNGCPTSPDTVSAVHIYPKKGNEYIGCAPGDLSMNCAYWYDATLRRITWRTATTTNLKIQYDWSMNGTEGACGIHASDPNAICLVTRWQGFVTTPGRVGGGAGFGMGAVVLCDRTLGTCPDQT